jgi:hypothetical protein
MSNREDGLRADNAQEISDMVAKKEESVPPIAIFVMVMCSIIISLVFLAGARGDAFEAINGDESTIAPYALNPSMSYDLTGTIYDGEIKIGLIEGYIFAPDFAQRFNEKYGVRLSLIGVRSARVAADKLNYIDRDNVYVCVGKSVKGGDCTYEKNNSYLTGDNAVINLHYTGTKWVAVAKEVNLGQLPFDAFYQRFVTAMDATTLLAESKHAKEIKAKLSHERTIKSWGETHP